MVVAVVVVVISVAATHDNLANFANFATCCVPHANFTDASRLVAIATVRA